MIARWRHTGTKNGRKAGAFAALLFAAAASAAGPPEIPAARTSSVSGESWVKHLHLSLDETTLGGIGRWGPAAGAGSPSPRHPAPEALDSSFLVNGRDLYRLS